MNDSSILLKNVRQKLNYSCLLIGDSLIGEIKSRTQICYQSGRTYYSKFYLVIDKNRITSIYKIGEGDPPDFRMYLSDFIRYLYVYQDDLIKNSFGIKRKKYGVLLHINFGPTIASY